MIDRRPTLLILALALAAGGALAWLGRARTPHPAGTTHAPATAPLAIDDRADDLALPDLHGATRHLSEWRGKRVLLNFWASWCGPCRQEMPALSAAQEHYASGGAQVIGIALDQPESVRAYLARTPVDYPILIGINADPVPTARFGDARGLLPYSVLIGRDGRILRTQLGALSPAELDGWLGGKG